MNRNSALRWLPAITDVGEMIQQQNARIELLEMKLVEMEKR